MKRLFLTIGLVAAGSLAYGQGTVQFSNGAVSKLSTGQTLDPASSIAVSNTLAQIPASPGLIEFGLFYGIGQSTSLTLLTSQFGVNSTTGTGLIANPSDSKSAMATIQLPGTTAAELDVWVQIMAWGGSFGTDYVTARNHYLAGDQASFWGQTAIVNINGLGPSTGPGVAIWQGATGTNPKLLNALVILQPVPEPATFALAGLGAATMLIFRRRK